MNMRLCGVSLIILVLAACTTAPLEPVTTDGLDVAVHALQQSAGRGSLCQTLQSLRAAEAVRSPLWECSSPSGEMTVPLVEVANSGEFGYTVSFWTSMDTTAALVATWRLEPDSIWRIEASIATRYHSAPTASRPSRRTGLGWVRASRQLYQEAARVSMLKADRDLAVSSMDVEATVAFRGTLSDSVVHLSDGERPSEGREATLKRLSSLPGLLTWVPVDGAIAATGDLGFTYGMQTVRPFAPDTALSTRPYLRVWRSKPDSTWEIIYSVLASALRGDVTP